MARVAKEKPDTEVNLMKLQLEYLATREDQLWQDMFQIMISYARSFVLKEIKGKVFLDPDHVLGVATDASIKIMERYKKDPTFQINSSFGGLLRWKVIESMYGDYQEDTCVSLNTLLSENNSNHVELGDMIASTNGLSEGESSETAVSQAFFEGSDELVKETVFKLLKELDSAGTSFRIRLVSRLFLLLIFRQSKLRSAVTVFKQQLSPKEEEVVDYLLLELHNRLSIESN